MPSLRYFVFAVLILSLVAVVPSVVAQITSGAITGVVTDASGAAVSGADVTVTSTQTGATRTATTSAEGTFGFQELSPGLYNITVSKQGFKKVQEKNIELHVSDITNVPIKLPLGTVAETVVVEASAVQVETQTGTVGNVLDG